MSGLRAAIVVPCYNEAKRLDVQSFSSYFAKRHDVQFVFVDDGSTDNTLGVLQSLTESDRQRFSVLSLERNQGKAEAVRQGMLKAFSETIDAFGYWDADLATPLEAIDDFCDTLVDHPQVEIVLGSRVKLLGHDIQRYVSRHYLGRIFATVVSLVLGIGVYDTQCGAKLFRATPEIRQLFEEPFLARWIFDVEIIARLIKARRGTDQPTAEQVMRELPLEQWRDVPGSKLKPSDFFKAIFELAAIYRRY